MPIYEWDNDQDRILRQVANKSVLKICCKVLDEAALTESWIRHHANIVGLDNLILADNMSSDPVMVRVLEEYSDRMTIFRFSGSHNEIHWHPRFRPFFQSIRENCRFFSFIDADERLVRIADDRCQADSGLVDVLASLDSSLIVASSWLINGLNSTDRYCAAVDGKKNYFVENLRWGKPILPSSLAGAQPGIHNAQYEDFRFSAEAGTAFFLLHLTQMPERRIAANRNKLISRGIVEKSLSADEILDLDFAHRQDKSFMPLVDEIRKMKALSNGEEAVAKQFYAGHHYFTLAKDGALIFDDETSRTEIAAFLSNGAQLIETTFNRSLPVGESMAKKLYDDAVEVRNTGNESRAEALLSFGMQAFPLYQHQFGGPAFQKELMRMYLSGRDWNRARSLIPKADTGFGTHWHCILFARAYTNAGDAENARAWWSAVLQFEPGNGEAKLAIDSAGSTDTSMNPLNRNAVIEDLHDVRELMSQSRVQAHWFMVQYFQHVRESVDRGYFKLQAMTESALGVVQGWSGQQDPAARPAIPRILHKIWLTTPSNPSEPPEDYITALLDDAAQLRRSGWQVLLWVQDENAIPRTARRISEAGGLIELRTVNAHIPHGKWNLVFDAFLGDRKFPFAADVLRMMILQKYGGFYADMGVRIKDPAVANFVAENFDYSFIFWETMFFQNSFMAMHPNSALAQTFSRLIDDPYLVPPSLITPLTGLSEGRVFSGLMVTAILLSLWRPDIRVFPFAPNRRLLSWSSQQSWYKKEGKFGNTYVPDSGPSVYSERALAERAPGSASIFA